MVVPQRCGNLKDLETSMMSTLLADFAAKRWNTKPFERLIDMLRLGPAAADTFAKDALSQVPDGGAFFHLALSFVSEPAFNELISIALNRLTINPQEEAASSVVAYASLQLPSLLHPHLAQVFTLRPNADTYYENWPWRDSGPFSLPHLAGVMNTAAPDARLKAWLCLLETRHQASLQYALDNAASLALPQPAELYLHEVGFRTPSDALFAPLPYHLVFPSDYFTESRPAWINRSLHPTWHVNGDSVSYRFGGQAAACCGLCSGPLHHLITVPGTLIGMRDSMASVSFSVCLSCLGWERPVLYYAHGTDGLPRPLDKGKITPQFPAGAIKESAIQLVLSPSRWRWQDWGLANGRENLHRFGGHPSWIQSAAYPTCPTCNQVMPFAFQLDSDLPTQDDGEWQWGSGGICYGFWCSPCRVSGYLWQCT
jgi:hypothetical protein